MAGPFANFVDVETRRLRAIDPALEHKEALKQALATWKTMTNEERGAYITPVRPTRKEASRQERENHDEMPKCTQEELLCDNFDELNCTITKLGDEGSETCIEDLLVQEEKEIRPEMTPFYHQLIREVEKLKKTKIEIQDTQ
jgi:hypothetical protein